MYVGDTVQSSAALNGSLRASVRTSNVAKLSSSHGPNNALVRITSASGSKSSTRPSASAFAAPNALSGATGSDST